MMKGIKEIFVSVTFMVILIFPMVDSVFHFVPEKEIRENRALKLKPELDWSDIDNFPEEFDKYYTDNFDFRNQFLLFNSRLKIQLFNVPPVNSKAIIGDDGWMYLIKNMKDVYLGKNIADTNKLKRYSDIFNYRKKYLDSIGCAYYIVIAPVKTSVYPEYLPLSQRNLPQTSLTDQLINLLDTIEELNIVDLRPIFRDSKGDIRMYHKTDTHWNAYGSYVAYKAIMNVISIDFPELIPHSISKYKIDSIDVKGMNLTSILGIYHGIFENKITCEPTFKKKSKEGQKRNYPVYEWFRFKSEYEQVFTTENDSLLKLMLVRDSFGKAIMPFLSEHFSESVYIFDGWHHDLNEDIVINEKPDIFVQLVLESQIPYLYKSAKKP
ncbi:MAG TPA: hypothetical protein QF480_03955 [Bacteroidales bacterium]|nr:hypothetical protein [Bacteroidales bacterium]|tara:strand:+ start:570 stop:1709 length:1140 start_codon:yes stop_codon:yes gene_type:complete